MATEERFGVKRARRQSEGTCWTPPKKKYTAARRAERAEFRAAQQAEHGYSSTRHRKTSIRGVFSPGSSTAGRSVFQHMHAYLVLLNKRTGYPLLPLFHGRKDKRRHLKAMFCTGKSTPHSSSSPATRKKERKEKKNASTSSRHGNPGTICSPSYLSPPGLSMLRVCRQCPLAPAGSPQFVSLPEVSLACRMICCSAPASPQRAAALEPTAPQSRAKRVPGGGWAVCGH